MGIKFRTFLWALIGVLFVNSVNALTLEEALTESIQNSRKLASAKQGWLAARETVYSSSNSNGNSISFSGSTSYSETKTGSSWLPSNTYSNTITLSKNIYDFGKEKENTILAKIQLTRAYASYKNTEQNVILETVKAYLNVFKTRRDFKLNEQNLDRLTAHVSAAELQVSEGTGTPTRVAEAEARYSRAKSDKAKAKANMENAEDFFTKLTKIDKNRMIRNKKMPTLVYELPTTINETANIANEKHPNVLTALAGEKAALQGIKTFKTQQRPDVSFSLSASEGKKSDSWSASVSLSSPLYDSGSTDANARKTVASYAQAKFDLDEARLTAQVDARAAFRNWEAAIVTLEAVHSEAEASRLAADGVRKEVKFGLKTNLNLLDAEKSVNDADLRLVSAEHDKMVAAFSLRAAVGTLTSEDLGLIELKMNFNELPRPENPLD